MAITGQNTGDYAVANDAGRWNACKKAITYAAGSTGAASAKTIFTVTGVVRVKLIAKCTATLTSGGTPTIQVGTTITGAGLLPQVANATTIATGEMWHMQDGTVDASVETESTTMFTKLVSEDIKETIGTTTITGGSLEYYLLWQPVSPDGTVIAA